MTFNGNWPKEPEQTLAFWQKRFIGVEDPREGGEGNASRIERHECGYSLAHREHKLSIASSGAIAYQKRYLVGYLQAKQRMSTAWRVRNEWLVTGW